MIKSRKAKTKKSVSKKKRIGVNVYIGKFEHVFNKKWQPHEIKALADEMIIWFETKTKNGIESQDGRTPIWLNDFAITKRVGRQRLLEFAKSNSYFNQVYTLCKEIQESVLFKLGLATKSPMPIFALKNVAGWTDKNSDESNISNEELEALRKFAQKLMAENI